MKCLLSPNHINFFNFFLLATILIGAQIDCRQSKEIHYDGFKLLRLYTKTLDQLEFLQSLSNEKNQLASIIGSGIDFWSEPKSLNSSIDLMVSPLQEKDLRKALDERQIQTETLMDDVGRIIDMQRSDEETSLFYSRVPNDTVFFQRYQPLSNIYQFLEDLVRANPDICAFETIGRSTEGRALRIVKIGYPGYAKPAIWIDAGIHAREWIAPATATFIINRLIRTKYSDETAELLKEFDFYILPSANPDGYEHSRLFDRFWRKTRSRNSNSILGLFCIGVDPNRNYGFQWKMAGSSSNPCSQTYHGPYPFSEPETKSISDFVYKNRHRVKLFVTLHSYSQLILTPWGWTHELPKAYPDLMRVAEIGATTLRMKYGTDYRYGSSPSILCKQSANH
ncbi:Carboxypeptidase A2 [Sarcoptes scabiei]|uniref:Carboxypeptidase A2 n=1 Tax=Sarcoptes scabiei TaxID=52283 RepID=A0A834VBY0_SARSC|nr:Carboxypeptidase A2 [Sarcoptes scabiei]